jgi:uncharacterized protein (UPF0303 family)
MADLHKELTEVLAQEDELQFDSFSNKEALDIGLLIIKLAEANNQAVEIDIEAGDHCLFHYAMKGTTFENSRWIARKKNMLKLDDKATYRVFLELGIAGQTFEQVYGRHGEAYAAGGGGFPIRTQEIGTIGSIIVSGLPHKEDHDLIVLALREYLNGKA